jgi:hypothetical protein
VGDGEADPARGSGDEGGAVWHGLGVLSVVDPLSNQGMRTPLTVIAVLLVVLFGIALVSGGGDDSAAGPPAASVDVIARRVEGLRDLRFKQIPKPVVVDPEQARRDGLADLDRQYPPAQRHADEEIYELLGLLDPGADLRELTGSLFEQGVAGYYDPRDGRLRVVTGAGTGSRVLKEMVLSHELTHALEDQRFSIDIDPATNDDRALAEAALREGTATALMQLYVQRTFSTEETLGGLLGAAFQDTGDLPPFLQAQVLFPYVGGEAFVEDLMRRAGGGWGLVNTAYRLREPSSTEQILHPGAYFDADEPKTVRIGAGAVLGPEWRRAAAGTWGELQTRELLAAAGGGAREAAEGWGGDRYELWRSRPLGECPAPCADADVLLMRWRWDTRRDEGEFAKRLREFVAAELGQRTVAGAGQATAGGEAGQIGSTSGPAVAVVRRAGAVTLVLAPDVRLAERLAAGT